jgi:hypothetical protein
MNAQDEFIHVNSNILRPEQKYSIHQLILPKNAMPKAIVLIYKDELDQFLKYAKQDTILGSGKTSLEIFKTDYDNARSENPIFEGQKISRSEFYYWIPNKSIIKGFDKKTIEQVTLIQTQKGCLLKLEIPKDHPCFRDSNSKYKYQTTQMADIIIKYNDGFFEQYLVAQKNDEPTSDEKNVSLEKMEPILKSILDSIHHLKQQIIITKNQLLKNKDKKFRQIEFQSAISTNKISGNLRCFIPLKSKLSFYTSLGTHQYSYSLFMDSAQYTWNDKNFSIQNLQESGTVQFQSAGIGIGKNWSFSNGSKTSGWGLQALIGGNVNFIKNANYQWTNGSANIRGYINGISDEIINVPDLGFQDGVTLSGMNGNADLKKWFPSMEGEIKLLYQFQNITFAGGVGYTYSAKLAGNHPENPIFNGQQSNSLTTSMMPLRISTSYCSLSTIIHF